jgi:hypothetical protein
VKRVRDTRKTSTEMEMKIAYVAGSFGTGEDAVDDEGRDLKV